MVKHSKKIFCYLPLASMAIATFLVHKRGFPFCHLFFFILVLMLMGKKWGGGVCGGTFEKVMSKRTNLLGLTCLHFFLGPLSGRKGHIQTVVQSCMPGLSRHRQ